MGTAKDKLNNLVTGFMHGVKNTENEIFTQIGGSTVADSSIVQQMQANTLADALLRGEVTQEVQELVYRTYLVDREAKKYEYFSPTLAKKFDRSSGYESKLVKYANPDNLEIITVQPVEREVATVKESIAGTILKTMHEKADYLTFAEPPKKYNITIERNFFPRFRIEQFARRVVVFKYDGENADSKVDFYVSKYTDSEEFISKSFINEVERVMNEGYKADMLEMESLYFMTRNAYLLDDMIEFKFENLRYDKTFEYDGHYVLSFFATATVNGHDKLEDYFNKEMADKYENKEPRKKTLDLTETFARMYVCERCGKQIFYDVEEMDDVIPVEPRYADDETEEEITDTTEYMDIQIAEQTYGKRLCRDCLKEYLKELGEIEELS